uniref:Uncharacterized protein n=1 Tax=uncultured marine group II/III euryarchaeote AD1000_88_C03 TaxID=1457820 RepID=A0A075G4Z5_9EURY|nr:hypothetical protein [uncultured marine group II/III euryarchaeote AD1000_88_C03]
MVAYAFPFSVWAAMLTPSSACFFDETLTYTTALSLEPFEVLFSVFVIPLGNAAFLLNSSHLP